MSEENGQQLVGADQQDGGDYEEFLDDCVPLMRAFDDIKLEDRLRVFAGRPFATKIARVAEGDGPSSIDPAREVRQSKRACPSFSKHAV